MTPRQPEGYDLKVPVGRGEAARLAFAAAPTASLPGPRRHSVRKGETLASVARKYRVSASRLADANGLDPRAKITRGEVLVIPGKSSAPAKTARKSDGSAAETPKVAAGAPQKGKKKPAAAETKAAARSYRVKGGDTLYSIARRTGTTVDSIMAANDLSSPEKIKPGDRLVIPPKAR